MNIDLLLQLGMSAPQANAYIFLVKNGPHSPPALARQLTESRTNTYNILDRLSELGLVKRYEEHNKYVFQAEPPTALQKLASQRRDEALQQERTLHATMPD